MNSIGVFREGEINGELFHIYSGEDLSVQPLFVCLDLRRRVEKLRREKSGYSDDQVIPVSTSPHFPNKTSFDQQFQPVFDSDKHSKICKLPLTPNLLQLKYVDRKEDITFCDACHSFDRKTSFYFCNVCYLYFHKECVEAPLSIKNPSYPFLSLQLSSCLDNPDNSGCISCGDRVQNLFYHCPTYNVKMHPFCAVQPIAIFIDHPKRHPHSLTFFPKQNSLPCNVCGLIKAFIPTYVCSRCVFVAHQDCIYFPYVIRICRHRHRISFIYSLPSGRWSCGVCRKKIDNDCGAYSCNKCEDYFVHSRCALRRDLWNGKELEGVDEELEIVVEPFETKGDGIILHFSHGHLLKLEISGDYDDEKFCQACVVPIYEGNYYSCMDQCDFILHESCASSPLKTYHPLHAHPLTLEVVTNEYDNGKGRFNCDACLRQSCGFVYESGSYRLDLRCGSVSEPFKYEGHGHPLYLALTPEEEESAICHICQDTYAINYSFKKLNCIECDFILCLTCATLPYKARYKHDKHLLTFRRAKEAGDQSGWCEVCEKKIVYSKKGGFYTCDEYCCTTLHVQCLLGTNPYMKPGQTIDIEFKKVHVRRNNTMSRPSCYECHEDRCLYRLVFRWRNGYDDTISFCSYSCAKSGLEDPW